ncbi:MAG: GGDEF domain-containing protein [Lachnospiraceae bacterium]|nr:GGDEF domain-containing protein [Lachnospiraceae bacterium]
MADQPEKQKRQSQLERVITGSYGVNHQEILEILAVFIIGVHVFMMFMYHIMGVWELSLYNVIATAYYSYCYSVVREGRVSRGYLLTFLEIIFQMVLTTIVIGWEAGFYTYVIAIIPLYYYISMFVMKNGDRIFRPMVWSLLTFITILAAYTIGQIFEPMEQLSLVQGSFAFVFNLLLSVQLIIWMSHFFVLGYKKSLDTLADQNANLDLEASIDPLTKLYNRRTMETALDAALAEAKKSGALFSLVMADIDFFKKINDTYGHDCGDVALVGVSEILKACVRDGDTVCRWGGEEFLLLVKGNRSVATTVAERIRSRIENNIVEYEGNQIRFTMTLGVSTYAPGYSLEKLVTQADENLYFGKEHGRNQVVSTKPAVTSTVSHIT